MVAKFVVCLLMLIQIGSAQLTVRERDACCRFEPNSQLFLDCCNRIGYCPDCTNLGFQEGSGRFRFRRDCANAWECCLYPFLSHQFHQCCFRHGCCPFCGDIPTGCCYGNEEYLWGDVVQELPEACVKLVCSALVTASRPHISAVIVPIHDPDCEGTPCKGALCGCVDENGIFRENGTEWSVTVCKRCYCDEGEISCRGVRPVCPPAPNPSCVAVPSPIPDDCCPYWNCTVRHICPDPNSYEINCFRYVDKCLSDADCNEDEYCCLISGCGHTCMKLCFDAQGEPRKNGESWQDPIDPCTSHSCEDGQIHSVAIRCRPPPPPRPDCVLVNSIGQCCPMWMCPNSCPDTHNFPQPCSLRETECRSNDDCAIGELCCLVAGCGNLCISVCIDDGVTRVVGEQWKSSTDPCVIRECTPGGRILEIASSCVLPPAPPNCEPRIIEGECCQVYNCSSQCPDPFSFNRVCVQYFDQCNTDEDCPEDRHCCLVAGCGHECMSVCIDDQGNPRKIDETWKDPNDACMRNTCTEDGIIGITLACLPIPRPHPECELIFLEGQCCPRWMCPNVCPDPTSFDIGCLELINKCEGIDDCGIGEFCCSVGTCGNECIRLCIDEQGNSHKVGDRLEDPLHPCRKIICTDNGIEASEVSCLPQPQPHPDCELLPVDDNCCPQWICPNECPDPDSFGRVCVHYIDQCQSDADCPNSTCCLVAGCGKECMFLCDFLCTTEFAPVCGSDGKTYANNCELNRANCKDSRVIKVGDGPCADSAPKPGICPDTTGIITPCVITENSCFSDEECVGNRKCCERGCGKECLTPDCNFACIALFRPVCGSDGVTYSNDCVLSRATCSNPDIVLLHEGTCE